MKYTKLIGLSIILSLVLTSCFRTTNNQSDEKESTDFFSNKFQKQVFKLNTVDDLYQFLTFNENRYPLVSAHRGGPKSGYPENAIETFEYWANQAPIIIECDVRLTKDSVLVMMHDETLDRTSTGQGKVNNYTLQEIKSFQLKDNDGKVTKYKIPTLEEVLLWGKGKVIFTLDVKQDIPYDLLSSIIYKTKAEANTVIITYSAAQARVLSRVNPELMISVSVSSQKDINKLAEFGIPDNRLVAFVGTSQAKPELVELLHAHGIQIILGTIGNLDKQARSKGYQVYADYIENGADILSTDEPEMALKALSYYIRKRNITSPFINN